MTQTSNGSRPGGQTAVDQAVDAVTRGQKALGDATTTVAEWWGAVLTGADQATRRGQSSAVPGLPVAVLSPGEVVDRTIDTSIAVLEMQRSVAHQVLDALRVR